MKRIILNNLTIKTNPEELSMKLVFIGIASLISVASATCPAATLANTVISGSIFYLKDVYN